MKVGGLFFYVKTKIRYVRHHETMALESCDYVDNTSFTSSHEDISESSETDLVESLISSLKELRISGRMK